VSADDANTSESHRLTWFGISLWIYSISYFTTNYQTATSVDAVCRCYHCKLLY